MAMAVAVADYMAAAVVVSNWPAMADFVAASVALSMYGWMHHFASSSFCCL